MNRLLPILFVFATALHAGQGLVIEQQQEELSNGKTSNATIYLEANRVAINNTQDGKPMTMVYLADQKLFRIIDHQSKTVREITEQDAEQLASKVSGAMAEMQRQMAERTKNMSPEQRAMIEKMMAGQMGQMTQAPAEQPKTLYSRGNGSATIAGRDCDWYVGRRGDQQVSSVCAADWGDFDFDAADFQVFEKMADFFGKLAPGAADSIRFGAPDPSDPERFPGVPVEQTSFVNGKAYSKSTIKDYRRDEIAADVYAVPAGYAKQSGLGL